MIGLGPDTFSWRIDFPPSPGNIILEADSISCLVGQNFLGKCVPPDTSAWQTDFPPTPGRGTVNYTHQFTILLTSLHDNADHMHHVHAMSPNKTEENRAQSLTCTVKLLLAIILCPFIVVRPVENLKHLIS